MGGYKIIFTPVNNDVRPFELFGSQWEAVQSLCTDLKCLPKDYWYKTNNGCHAHNRYTLNKDEVANIHSVLKAFLNEQCYVKNKRVYCNGHRIHGAQYCKKFIRFCKQSGGFTFDTPYTDEDSDWPDDTWQDFCINIDCNCGL